MAFMWLSETETTLSPEQRLFIIRISEDAYYTNIGEEEYIQFGEEGYVSRLAQWCGVDDTRVYELIGELIEMGILVLETNAKMFGDAPIERGQPAYRLDISL